MAENLAGPLSGSDMPSVSAGFEAFLKIAELWRLSSDEQIKLLGSPARSTYFKWKKDGGVIPADTLERISHILSIFKALEILIPDADAADSWVRRENDYFDGQSALNVMLGGQVVDIYRVRQYLDAQRGC
ncbi:MULTISPECIES: MbcA/ParS/Xre antitoxin family protein [unclassified Sphingomonas]|uniref:MbcA/ParS/Xre antitoxin family protein n=1 Tax=unclassified Sphingomonas TaxID=196159 RepID=UPI0021514388|nr:MULTISPECIES: MbcA/ParS/Xre antitoxin family protein [unclassified Sphingomonas]MCR5870358.1 MbcA/ParS/Xre antitoxin family protein [Sphingomonas sp. J344]UUY01307.1 MbcA/ParS/Xre antitoxin family protein [Sphingomonas sp. J315]